MNQQRLQAYYQLIQNLLNCPSGKEAAILQANIDLLDVGFLQALEAAAEYFAQQGNKNNAGWLKNLATQLVAGFNSNITTPNLETYEQFLLKALQATVESNGNTQVVYPLLVRNIDKLDDNFVYTLRHWATNALAEAEAEIATSIAGAIGNFSNLIKELPLGDKASNLEIAIAGYETSLIIYTRANFPQDWAKTQNNLGAAYRERIRGDKADNLEKAITAYTSALQILTRADSPQALATIQNNLGNIYSDRIRGDKADNLEKTITAYTAALQIFTYADFPQDWATTQNNLGAAYSNRIRGDKADNLEKAITAYTDALQVRTRGNFPQNWAATQINLGNAYSKRIRGDKADNLEKVITAYSAALQIFTRADSPQNWAMTQSSLGEAYHNRILGDKAENIEQAITAYSAALQIFTRADFPQDWATAQNNLGEAYRIRILRDKAENIEQAIAAYSAALQVRTYTDFPHDWAMTQSNLGAAYRIRILGDKAENIEQAIAAYSAALQVRTYTDFPQDWAITQNNLGNAYSNRILGDKAENIEQAIAAYSAALQVRTYTDFPQDWAITQNNLGNAYSNRILGDKAENIEQAIAAFSAALQILTCADSPQDWATTQNNLGAAYRNIILRDKAENLENAIAAFTQALSVYTQSAFPQNNAETLLNLGRLYQEEKQFELAYNTFIQTIETVESIRFELVSGEEAKRKQAEEWNELYRRMVEVCLKLGRNTEAIEYIERSKTRNLVELILNRDLKTIFPPKVVTQLEQLRDEIASGQYQLQNGKAENPTVLAQHLQQLREQRNKLQDKYLPVGSGFKFNQFQKSLAERTAIIEWYIASDRILAFVVKPHRQELTFWQSQPEDLDALNNWIREYLRDYYNPKDQYKVKWQNQLEERLKKLAEILHIEEILAQVPKECDRLILIPHRFLHLFPLHALPVGESYLLDLFPKGVGYSPSCQLLQQVQLRQRRDFKSLFAIQNPTEDLNYADLEVESILPLFSSQQVLLNSQATKAALTQATPHLREVNCLHFSCHGSFDPNSPLDSCLVLANPYDSSDEKALDLNKCLTLGNLFERDFDLNQCRLVVLSACETGLIDPTNTSDEYIGLPSGFLYAGSVSVVNSLWTVNDLSTSFLMIKFFQNFQAALTANQDMSVASLIIKFFQKCQAALTANQDMSVASALKEAQLWLRNASKEELQQWTGKLQLDSTWRRNISRYFNTIKSGDKPFKSPYHWAAFTAVGK